MRIVALSVLFFLTAGVFFLSIPTPQKASPAVIRAGTRITQPPIVKVASPAPALPLKKKLPKFLGERITYDVRFKGLSMGKANFYYESYTKLNGTPALLMTFTTKLARFFDKETIYGNPDTFLPIRIERDIVKLYTKEKITEEYDQSNCRVSITKLKRGKKETVVLQKDAPIQNAILLPHYVRQIPNLTIDTRINVTLPTRTIEIALTAIENVKTPTGTFKAYHFESRPSQIEIWMTADERKIPIKMRGTGLFGYVMVMEKYQSPDKEDKTEF